MRAENGMPDVPHTMPKKTATLIGHSVAGKPACMNQPKLDRHAYHTASGKAVCPLRQLKFFAELSFHKADLVQKWTSVTFFRYVHAMIRIWVFVALLFFPVVVVANTRIVRGDRNDGQICRSGDIQNKTQTVRVGAGGDVNRGHVAVYFFELPALEKDASIASAELNLSFVKADGANIDFAVDLFALPPRSNPQITKDDYHDGPPSRSTEILIQASIVTSSSKPHAIKIKRDELVRYLQSLYKQGQPTAAFAVFRLSPDRALPVGVGQNRGFQFGMSESRMATVRPSLVLSTSDGRGLDLALPDSGKPDHAPEPPARPAVAADNVDRPVVLPSLERVNGQRPLPTTPKLTYLTASHLDAALLEALIQVHTSTHVYSALVETQKKANLILLRELQLDRQKAIIELFTFLTRHTKGVPDTSEPVMVLGRGASAHFKVRNAKNKFQAIEKLLASDSREKWAFKEYFRSIESRGDGRMENNQILRIMELLSDDQFKALDRSERRLNGQN